MHALGFHTSNSLPLLMISLYAFGSRVFRMFHKIPPPVRKRRPSAVFWPPQCWMASTCICNLDIPKEKQNYGIQVSFPYFSHLYFSNFLLHLNENLQVMSLILLYLNVNKETIKTWKMQEMML